MILQKDPKMRPTLVQIESHPFFQMFGPMPPGLPIETHKIEPTQTLIENYLRTEAEKVNSKKLDEEFNVLKQIAKTNPELLVKNLEYYEENAEQLA